MRKCLSPAAFAVAIVCLAALPRLASAERVVSEESKIFDVLQDGVFTVYSEYGQGTGFLVSEDGLVMTNAHVLSTSRRIRVLLEPDLKVAAEIVELDDREDVAVVRINPKFCEGRSVLRLAQTEEEQAFVGERVLAIGSPLSQDKVLTTGIVSRIQDGAIISDVNINPGNSGGPLINLDSNVIGINTFAESADAGPGLSGTIHAEVVLPVLERAKRRMELAGMPGTELYPCAPRAQYPLEALERAARVKEWPDDLYDARLAAMARPVHGSSRRRTRVPEGDFVVQLITPPRMYNMLKRGEVEISSQAAQTGDYDPFGDLKNWTSAVGAWRPVVTVAITPRIGATGGSQVGTFFSSLLAGTDAGHLNYEYKGDVRHAELWVDGELVQPYLEYLDWIPMSFTASSGMLSVSGKGMARSGVLIVDPAWFESRDGEWPRAEVRIWNAEDEDRPEPLVIEIPRAAIERITIDFEPWYQHLRNAQHELDPELKG